MSGARSTIFRTIVRRTATPVLTGLYARLGFGHRKTLAPELNQFGNLQNQDLLLDRLFQRGILKGRFIPEGRSQIKSAAEIEEHMLCAGVTKKQIEAIAEDIEMISAFEKAGSTPTEMIEALEQAEGVLAAGEALIASTNGKTLDVESIFNKSLINAAGMFDRIFPGANGIHSKLAQGIESALFCSTLPKGNGKYKLGFIGAVSLGIIATIASPFLLPVIGAFLCKVGATYALGMQITFGSIATLGIAGRIASKYIHKEGKNSPDSWVAKLGRNKIINKVATPLGLAGLYGSLTFGGTVSNTFVLGNFLLQSGALIGGITAGIPLLAIIGSLIYYHVGYRRAIKATEDRTAPYGDRKLAIKDIKKTYRRSGTAVVFSTMYFLYRFIATSIFVTAAFNPVTLGATALTMGGAFVGFTGSYLLLPRVLSLGKKFRSPWTGLIMGTFGSVAVPFALGAIFGDYISLKDSISALLSLTVFAADIHSTTHGVMFHRGQTAAIYEDRLVPSLSMTEKRAYAGYFGRKGERPITSFSEKAFVEHDDIVFSAITSAFFEPNAHLKQCILQCDAPTRGKGGGWAAAAILKSAKIRDQSQEELNKVYTWCRAELDKCRENPAANRTNYLALIALLRKVGGYFEKDLPDMIKKMADENKQEWKGIYDATLDISIKKGNEFRAWASELENRLENRDQLTHKEVENIMLYLCDRFDKEIMMGVRKDSAEFVMRVQKNENQAGTREFIGNTGVEILRYNAKDGEASIERLLATHIRRQDMKWEHTADSDKYTWYHLTDKYLENDADVIKEYRKKVKSHSKDLAFVINDKQGNPLAIQARDGQILLIAQNLGQPISLKLADGTDVTVWKQDGVLYAATPDGSQYFDVTTVKSYNKTHDSKIYLVANAHADRSPIPTGEAFHPEMSKFYKDRPLYTYSIDPHDYEINLDSEFVNGRTCFEYIPVFEADRQNKHAAISYRHHRTVELDYHLSGIPVDRDGEAVLPDNVQLNWSPMHMRVRTRDGQEIIAPYLEEKNAQIEPTVTVEKKPIDPQTLLTKYADGLDASKTKHDKDNKVVNLNIKHEHITQQGINEIILAIPEKVFTVNGTVIVPKSPEEVSALVQSYLAANPEENISIVHKRIYNWREIVDTQIMIPVEIEVTRKDGDGKKTAETETIFVPTENRDVGDYSGDFKSGNIVPGFVASRVAEVKDSSPEIKGIKVRKLKDLQIHFVYNTENGTRVTSEAPRHHSNRASYSVHLPPLSEIESIETEVFKQSVGTLPYARYMYQRENLAEVQALAKAEIATEADPSKNQRMAEDIHGNKIAVDQNGHPVMKKGCQIWATYNKAGKIVSYDFERFGRPESIMELGALDPTSVDKDSIKIKTSKVTGRRKLVFEAIEWGRKMFPIEKELMDLGSEETPKAKIKGVITKGSALRKIFGFGPVLWSKDGDNYHHVNIKKSAKFWDKVKTILKKIFTKKFALSIIDVAAKENKKTGDIVVEVTSKQKYGDLMFTDSSLYQKSIGSQLLYSSEWVDYIEFGNMTDQGREVHVYYKNPHTEQPLEGGKRRQTVRFSKKNKYLKSDNKIANYHEPVIEQREIYDKEGNCTLVPYIKVSRVKRSRIILNGKKLSKDDRSAILKGKLSIVNPRSALKLKMRSDQSEAVLPLNDKVDGADYIFEESKTTEAERDQFAHHLPSFEDGKIGLMIGPQLSISGRNWFGYAPSGHPYCALDQSIFMAYDLSKGYNYGRQPYTYGVAGGSIQPHKSRGGDGRIRETTTVQNGTPVGRPLRKTIASGDGWNEAESRIPFFSFAPMPATITEDYREGKGIYKKHGHAVVFNNTVVAIGAGVDSLNQILTQRRRWPASVPIGQFWFFRDLLDEFKPGHPSYYTWDQLLHEWNGVTWYYCGIAENARSYAPLAYFGGLTAYPVDAIAFPLLWFGMFTSSMASHIYSMKKVGNHWLESVYWGQTAYKTLVPNYTEMIKPQVGMPKTQGLRASNLLEELTTSRLGKEALGQFGVTALVGGGAMPARYLQSMRYNVWLKGAAFARGLLEMQNVSHLNNQLGGFAPGGYDNLTTYFAIAMNTIWPLYDMLLNRGGMRLANNRRDKTGEMHDGVSHKLRAQMLTDRLDYKADKKWWQLWKLRPQKFLSRNKMQYTLGITDAPKTIEDKARYLESLPEQAFAPIFREIPNEAAPMFNKMLNRGLLKPHKLSSVFESMVGSQGAIEARAKGIFQELLKDMKSYKGQNLAQLYAAALTEANAEAAYSAGFAAHIFNGLNAKHQSRILENMKEEQRNALIAILGRN